MECFVWVFRYIEDKSHYNGVGKSLSGKSRFPFLKQYYQPLIMIG